MSVSSDNPIVDAAYRRDQPEITVVNINSNTSPRIFRCNHADISAPATLLRLAQFLEAEDALIVNLSLSPGHLSVLAALKDQWLDRFQSAVHEGWQPAKLEGPARVSMNVNEEKGSGD